MNLDQEIDQLRMEIAQLEELLSAEQQRLDWQEGKVETDPLYERIWLLQVEATKIRMAPHQELLERAVERLAELTVEPTGETLDAQRAAIRAARAFAEDTYSYWLKTGETPMGWSHRKNDLVVRLRAIDTPRAIDAARTLSIGDVTGYRALIDGGSADDVAADLLAL